ncbi:MAG TPA: TRAM domain-containing protein [Acidimicrobiales bacterium]|nr:TRAM domain-containing protein [Acidimicrobiales bacterium]
MVQVEVTASGMAAGGDALAREESGRVVFVSGALPGERVLVDLTEQRKDFARGHVVQVLDPSADRVAPPCPHVARGCGGCQWQHAGLAAQARYKADVVADALRRIAHRPDPPIAPDVVRLPDTATRTTVRFRVVDGRPAFHRRQATDLVSVNSCLVAHPLVEEVLRDGRFDGAEEVAVRVGAGTGERLVVAHPNGRGVIAPPDVRVVGTRSKAWYHEEVADRRWRVSALSFFQSGREAAQALVDAVRGAAGPRPRRVLDAYAGVGVLGGALEPERLEAIESTPSAAADARSNLADLGADVFEQEVATWVADRPGSFDVVVADPARPGLGKSAAAALAAAQAPRLVLVSCDPASLARDTNLLDDLGYDLASVQVLDLFPHTFHVEAVSRFELR